jgi:hypothetical protein
VRALALKPLFAPWHEELGLMYYRAGRLSEAKAELHKTWSRIRGTNRSCGK